MIKEHSSRSLLVSLVLMLTGMATLPVLGGEVIPLKEGWKFIPGDNLTYARPDFDDSGWVTLRSDKYWEEQGYEKLDGYAWYRLRVVIPGQLRQAAYLKDGLRICLGKINNFDQAFLNGRLFGINGKVVDAATPTDATFTKAASSLWDVERFYVLPADDPRIQWDRENVLAVRVFDEGGQGGLWSGDQNMRMITLSDYLANDSGAHPFEFKAGAVGKSFTLKNTSAKHTLSGTLTVQGVNNLTGGTVLHHSDKVDLAPGGSRQFTITMARQDQSTRVTYELVFAASGEKYTTEEVVPYILTPPPPPTPRINGPAVVGARPNKPFLFAISATGARPITFSARSLPLGLNLDPATGIITGRVAQRGNYKVTLEARNAKGKVIREVTFAIGERIALTPPLGWNSWNCWGLSVDQDKVLSSAKVFKAKGLADHGWAYINIDDGWEIKGDSPDPKRDEQGRIRVNEKFPGMKALGDEIHKLGLKFGIYSSPGPLTCGGYTASYAHEQQDANSWAGWGIDYIKYDWCSYDKIAQGDSREELQKPYREMRKYLDAVDRDIVYSLCQYGMGKVWEWGADVGGNLWRTTDDITDNWKSLSSIGFSQVENAPFAGPGHWNDPDMLVVGWVGWGPSLHPTQLTPDEQYTHISLWCLLSAPLLIGCDLERLDDFTLNLLTNDEVLALDQDPLGKQATPVAKQGQIQAWVKELADANKAVGIFNLGEAAQSYSLKLSELGLAGKVKARDLWRQKDLGVFNGAFPAKVPAHGVVLVKLTMAK